MSISIRELHPLLGVEVGGVDLSKPPSLETVAEIRQTWGRHGVLVFRDQDISDPEHVAFAQNFGDLEVLPERDHTDGRLPEIFKVSNIGDLQHAHLVLAHRQLLSLSPQPRGDLAWY
jgi:taurine dioxygenase